MPRPVPRIVLLTGMAGAGKTTAVRAFEDLGFFCVDNLPIQLLDTFLTLLDRGNDSISKVALVMDAREKDFTRKWPKVFEAVARVGYRLEVVFLDATDAALVRRFSETRRRHPLAPGGDGEPPDQARPREKNKRMTVTDAIALERELLSDLRGRADLVVDTTELTVHQLKAIINRDFSAPGARGGLTINVLSFGFRYGPPREADLMIDVRFLPNPNFMPGLKEKTGLDRVVSNKVLASKDGKMFMQRLGALLDFLIPRYGSEGKAYLTIGIGCTGGRHRSVAVAERIGKVLSGRKHAVNVVHRDVERST